jgi:hypothetical protein
MANAWSCSRTLSCTTNFSYHNTSVPEIIDPVFAKTSPKRSLQWLNTSVLGLFSRKRGSINSSIVPEFIDPVFAKTSPKRSFSMTENERIGLVFAKTGSINSGTVFQNLTDKADKATFESRKEISSFWYETLLKKNVCIRTLSCTKNFSYHITSGDFQNLTDKATFECRKEIS